MRIMSSSKRLTRMTIPALATVGALAAVGPAVATAAPVVPNKVLASTSFQLPETHFAGETFLRTQAVSAVQAKSGHVRFTSRVLSPSCTPPNFSWADPMTVRWVNLSTGASGSASIPVGFGDHCSASSGDVPTGRGQVAAMATGTLPGLYIGIPGLGTFHTE